MVDVRVLDKYEYVFMVGWILWLLFVFMFLFVFVLYKCLNIMNLCVKVVDDVFVVEVDVSVVLVIIDEVFLCVILDWWFFDKCDYGICVWG